MTLVIKKACDNLKFTVSVYTFEKFWIRINKCNSLEKEKWLSEVASDTC